MSKLKKTDQSLSHQVLDPCLLGRPVHLLHTFTAQLREDFSHAFRVGMNCRYWSAFQIDEVGMARVDGPTGGERWIDYEASAGSIGFSLERGVLLSVLNRRYGNGGNSANTANTAEGVADGAPSRVTATEERLAITLGQQLASTLAARIELNLSRAAGMPAAAPAAALKMQDVHAIKAAPGSAPPNGSWTICIVVRDVLNDLQGRLWFALDHTLMSDVLRGLVSMREKPKTQSRPPLASHLQLKLTGRLLSQEVTLGELLEMRIGDIIPVRLGKTDVLLEDSRLFTAAVTEHKGKLCLTSFEDAQ